MPPIISPVQSIAERQAAFLKTRTQPSSGAGKPLTSPLNTTPGTSIYAKKSKQGGGQVVNGFDISTSKGLADYAKSRGLEINPEEKKLSFLQRLGRGLSALEPADAIYKSAYDGKNFAVEYVRDILTEAGSAITGKEYRTDQKKTMKDILVREGMKDREGKIDLVDVLGLAGDIATDPSTWFGGAFVKAGGKVVKGVGKVAETVGMKVAPRATTIALEAADAAKDAFGRAFIPGFASSGRAITEGVKDLAPELQDIAHQAIGFKTEEDFVKAFKDVELGGKTPQEFYNTFTKKDSLYGSLQKYINQKSFLRSGVGEKVGAMFKDLSPEVRDEITDVVYGLRKGTMAKRDYMIGERTGRIQTAIKTDARQIARNLNELKYNYRANSQVVSEIERLQNKLLTNQDNIADDLGLFLSDASKPSAQKTYSATIGKVPPPLLGEASLAQRYKTFDDFMLSADSHALDKKVLSGEMEAMGYPGDIETALEKFYNDATGLSFKPGSKKISPVVKKMDPLPKVAEEFVKSKSTVYRGGSTYFPQKINSSEGVSFSYDKKIAQRFDNMAKGKGGTGGMESFHIEKNAKIIDMQDIPKELWNSEYDMVAYAKKNGFDGIKIDALGQYKEAELRIINPEVIKTNSQLTDIWNKAQEKVFGGGAELSGTKVTAEALAKSQKGVTQMGTKLEDLKNIDLESTLDAVRKNEVAIDEFTKRSEIHKKALGSVFEDTTRQLVDKESIIPASAFKTAEGAAFYREVLLPYLIAEKKDIAEITGMKLNQLFTNYFPAIKEETKEGFAKALGKAPKVGKEGRMKVSKGILTKDEIIKDPAEAYAQAAAEVRADGLTKEYLTDIVARFGRSKETFKNSDEALKAGYRMIKENGPYGRELGWLKADDVKMINEVFDPSFKTLTDLAKASGFDKITSLFKMAVTGLFPSFHVRNFISGMMQNFEVVGPAIFNPKMSKGYLDFAQAALSKHPNLEKLEPIAKELGIEAKTLIKEFRDRFGVSSQYISDFGWETQEKLLKGKQNILEMTRNVGNFIEAQQKSQAFLISLRKGHSLDEALNLAEQAGFDYSRLTPFEKNIMRRIIPFYSYSRKNLELQLKVLRDNPGRIGTLTKVFRNAGAPQGLTEGEATMPDWMRKQFSVVSPFGLSAKGLPEAISGFGTPMEEFAGNFDNGPISLLIKLNPILKVPLERATGKDFFRDKDLKDVYDAKEYSNAPDFVKGWLKIVKTQKEIYEDGKPTGKMRDVYVADPERLHIARNLFTARGIGYLDNLFGDNELSPMMRALKAMSGLKPYEIDEETTNYFNERDNIRDLTDYLKRLNVLNTFERSYVSKSMKAKPVKLEQY